MDFIRAVLLAALAIHGTTAQSYDWETRKTCEVQKYNGFRFESDKKAFLLACDQIFSKCLMDVELDECFDACRSNKSCQSLSYSRDMRACTFAPSGLINGNPNDGGYSIKDDAFTHYSFGKNKICGPNSCGAEVQQFPIVLTKSASAVEAIAHSWPWMVLLRIRDGEKVSFCTAILLPGVDNDPTHDIVFTLASCVTKKGAQGEVVQVNNADVEIYAESPRAAHELDGTKKWHLYGKAADIRVNPVFMSEPNTEFIALIRIEAFHEHTISIHPICRRPVLAPTLEEIICVAAGFVRSGDNSKSNDDPEAYVIKQTVVDFEAEEVDPSTHPVPPFVKPSDEPVNHYHVFVKDSPAIKEATGNTGGMLMCTGNHKNKADLWWTLIGFWGRADQESRQDFIKRNSKSAAWVSETLQDMKRVQESSKVTSTAL